MIKAICMCGSEESLRRLREAFRHGGIDLENRDYQLEQDIIESLQAEPEIAALLVVEHTTRGLEDGKYGLIERIRAVDESVRIVFCGSSEKRDAEFENWCYKYSVYDFFYPKKDDSYDIGVIMECMRLGRFNADKSAQVNTANTEARQQNRLSGGFLQKIGLSLPKKQGGHSRRRILPHPPQAETAPEHEQQAVTPPPVKETPPPSAPVELIREVIREVPVEVVREVPVERQVIRHVEKSVSHGAYTVAVFSLSRGAGATTMAHNLAEALCRTGVKTMLVAADGSSDLRLAKGRAAQYIAVSCEEAINALQRFSVAGYDFMVADFGHLFDISGTGEVVADYLTEKSSLINEFFRCHMHIGMGFAAPWHREKIRCFTGHEAFAYHLEHGRYLLVLDGEVKRLKHPGLEIFTRAEATPEMLAAILMPMENAPRQKIFARG